MEKGGIYEDEDEDDVDKNTRPESPSYNQEQINIKNAFKRVIEDDDDDDDNEWGGIFRKREKSKDEEVSEVKNLRICWHGQSMLAHVFS